MDTLSLVLMVAALAGAVLRAYLNGTLQKKETIGDIVICGIAGGVYTAVGSFPKDLSIFHAALIMFAVAYVAADALQALVKGVVGRFTGPLIPPTTKPICILSLLLPLALVGCTTPISGTLTKDITAVVAPAAPGHLGGVVIQGLTDAAYNLDQAVVVGALDKTDPAPACFHGMLAQLGVEVPAGAVAPASFTPKVSDLISAGSVLYIRAAQLRRLRGGGIAVPTPCKELVAQFMLDAAAASTDLLPGGGLLPKLR